MFLKGDDLAEVLKRWKNIFCSVLLHIKQLYFYVLVAFNNETLFHTYVKESTCCFYYDFSYILSFLFPYVFLSLERNFL
jgi:hypothetical protein